MELIRLHRDIEGLATQGGAAAFLNDLLHRSADREDLQIGTLLKALGDRRRVADAPWTGNELLALFESLLLDLASEEDGESRDTHRAKLELYLQDYSGREGNFARMMSGSTTPQTRRTLQSAFNGQAVGRWCWLRNHVSVVKGSTCMKPAALWCCFTPNGTRALSSNRLGE